MTRVAEIAPVKAYFDEGFSSPRARPLVSRLVECGFQCTGRFWEESGSFWKKASPGEAVLYAFVASKEIKSYSYSYLERDDRWEEIRELRPENDNRHILPREVFYLGSSKSLRSRIAVHKNEAAKGRAWSGAPVIALLREAKRQNAPVDVYIRRIPTGLVMIDGLPLDPLRGYEAGLIQKLTPLANRRFR